jgi:hypothetical protein
MSHETKTRIDFATDASHAHSNLNVFHIVKTILESGAIYESRTAESTADKIVELCEKEMKRQVANHDRALRKVDLP